MQKFLTALTTSLLAFSLTACGGGGGSDKDETNNSSTTYSPPSTIPSTSTTSSSYIEQTIIVENTTTITVVTSTNESTYTGNTNSFNISCKKGEKVTIRDSQGGTSSFTCGTNVSNINTSNENYIETSTLLLGGMSLPTGSHITVEDMDNPYNKKTVTINEQSKTSFTFSAEKVKISDTKYGFYTIIPNDVLKKQDKLILLPPKDNDSVSTSTYDFMQSIYVENEFIALKSTVLSNGMVELTGIKYIGGYWYTHTESHGSYADARAQGVRNKFGELVTAQNLR